MNSLQKRFLVILTAICTGSIVLAVVAYQILPSVWTQTVTAKEIHTTVTAVATPASGPVDPSTVHGIDSGPPSSYPGITWTRLSYKTCGGKLAGDTLKNAIQLNHSAGVHVLLLLCQTPSKNLLSKVAIDDIAAAHADAVACGNEQMKHNTYPTYVAPADYARFFDLCETTVHAVSPGIPVLMGSLDPHVGYSDTPYLLIQAQYLNAMEKAMNTVVHPGGHWSWRSQAIGLIDSWHNGFPNSSINSLQALFTFWAQQFHVNLAKGELGKHLWVVEGTGCVYQCGLNSPLQISVAHILTLITDVQAAVRYHIPFFYFSGKDFTQKNGLKKSSFWPMGVLDKKGKAKGLRQDLALGARTLRLSCANGKSVSTTLQEPLLAMLYSGCTVPSNYAVLLT